MHISDQIVLVTGGTRGLDAALTQSFLDAGARVVVNNALADFSFNGDARNEAGDLAWEDVAAQFSGSVRGALDTVQQALPGMRRAGFGRVVNIGINPFQNPVAPTTTTRRPRPRKSSTTSRPARRCGASPHLPNWRTPSTSSLLPGPVASQAKT